MDKLNELNPIVQKFMVKQEQARAEQNGKMASILDRFEKLNEKFDEKEKIRLEMRGQISNNRVRCEDLTAQI